MRAPGLALAAVALWLVPAAGAVAPTAPPTAGSSAPSAPAGAATYAGSETCAQCHYDKFTSYVNQPHSLGGDPRTPAAAFGCESCHGPGSAHVAGGGGRGVGGLMTFARTAPTSAAPNDTCLKCHTRGPTALWHGSTHDARKVACTDCHLVHGGHQKLLAQPTQQQLCVRCHQQVRQALAKSSHHPLREEKMQCTSCHNPHGTQAPRLIAANSANDKCFECHAEKRGPFLFEHPPVRESCMNCHDPHGSSHKPLLLVKKPLLCQRCHSNVQHPSTLYALTPEQRAAGVSVYARQAQNLYRGCTNCHVAVHGSNSPSGKFWHR
jgi:DmsE family decaheme c-type cytochrome